MYNVYSVLCINLIIYKMFVQKLIIIYSADLNYKESLNCLVCKHNFFQYSLKYKKTFLGDFRNITCFIFCFVSSLDITSFMPSLHSDEFRKNSAMKNSCFLFLKNQKKNILAFKTKLFSDLNLLCVLYK